MRKLIVSEFLSLDGVMEAPHLWHFPYLSNDMEEYVRNQIFTSDALMLGRLTYEEFAGYWSTATDPAELADKLNSMSKYVVSTTLQKAEWNNTTLISENVPEAITKLKQQSGGNIGITGSAALIQSLMQTDLIDEYHLLVHPIVVGKGKRLFKDGQDTTPLKLVESTTFNSGAIALVYQPSR